MSEFKTAWHPFPEPPVSQQVEILREVFQIIKRDYNIVRAYQGIKQCVHPPKFVCVKSVCVYPDGEQYDEAPSWKSDDYETRQTMLCEECDEELTIHYGEPFASCKCGTQEWYE